MSLAIAAENAAFKPETEHVDKTIKSEESLALVDKQNAETLELVAEQAAYAAEKAVADVTPPTELAAGAKQPTSGPLLPPHPPYQQNKLVITHTLLFTFLPRLSILSAFKLQISLNDLLPLNHHKEEQEAWWLKGQNLVILFW